MSTCHRRKAGRKRCRVGTMSLATSCDIMRHHATSCDRERKQVGSGWRKMSFDRRRCGRETRWRERKAGGSRKRKRKTGDCRKRRGFPLQHLYKTVNRTICIVSTILRLVKDLFYFILLPSKQSEMSNFPANMMPQN